LRLLSCNEHEHCHLTTTTTSVLTDRELYKNCGTYEMYTAAVFMSSFCIY